VASLPGVLAAARDIAEGESTEGLNRIAERLHEDEHPELIVRGTSYVYAATNRRVLPLPHQHGTLAGRHVRLRFELLPRGG
jgi:hypothetical protein